jgi:DNA-binding NarL/FixJ family response regulator
MTPRVELERAVLHARIVAALGEDTEDAFALVLDLGRPDRFVRTVVSRDREYARVLDDFLVRSPRDSYGDELLSAIGQMVVLPMPGDRMDGPLSERERVVLRYLPTRMSYREIAGELYVSMNTLKTHLKSIYRKLDASSRAEATEHARRRGML